MISSSALAESWTHTYTHTLWCDVMISFLALAQSRTHTHLMLRYYVMISSLALAHRRDATLWFLLLHLHNLAHIHTHWMLRYDIFSFTCTISCTNTHTHTRDARLWYFLLHLHNLAHTLDATLWFLALHLHNLARTHTHLMLRYDIFFWTESTNGFSGTIWQSGNWPTTWKKDGKRAD